MLVRPFDSENGAEWDELVERSLAGTFLHTRRFLSYHRNRFRDLSVCLHDDSNRLIAILPAAVDPADSAWVTSHPGATYGGIIHDGLLRGTAMIEAFEAIRRYYRGLGFAGLRYKAIPRIYHRAPAEDDLYALFRLDARRYRCDLAAVIDLAQRLPTSRRRKRCLKAAWTNGVSLDDTVEPLPCFWPLLAESMRRRHGARPVHTYEEMELLQSRFPDRIRLTTASAGQELLGGVILFAMSSAVHVQYSCSSEHGFALHALDAIIEHCILEATRAGARWFSMGISNEADGRLLNEGLHRFKTEFGAGAVVHEFYELALR